MFNRHRRGLALVIAAVCLVLVTGAAAAEDVNTFSAIATPTYIRPSTAFPQYTVMLKNTSSSKEADRAEITAPADFHIESVQAASVEDQCNGSLWTSSLNADTITVTKPDGNPTETALCPGATLTVSFSVVSGASNGTFSWTTALYRGDEAFALDGNQPTVIVDGNPPDTSITSYPPSLTNVATADFSFSSTEAGSKFECALDGDFAPCPNPKSYSGLADGPHAFGVRAIDLAENRDASPATYTWTVETRAPTAAVSSGPAPLSNSRSAAFTFGADEPSSFQCQLDGGSFAACTSPASYQNLGDGAHTFVVRPTDAVGNVGTVASYTWTIDATAPETVVRESPQLRTTKLVATFTFAATEQATFQCRLDGAAFEPCASPKSYSGLRRTAHTFEVRSIDRAGNADATPAVYRWTITALPRTVKRTSALFAPRAGARVTAPPLLAWRRVPRASYYNVQLYRGRVKILSTWPTRTRIQLRSRWTYLGKRQKLSPGVYRWYVWPGYGRARAHRYGAMLGQSRFTVIAPKTR